MKSGNPLESDIAKHKDPLRFVNLTTLFKCFLKLLTWYFLYEQTNIDVYCTGQGLKSIKQAINSSCWENYIQCNNLLYIYSIIYTVTCKIHYVTQAAADNNVLL